MGFTGRGRNARTALLRSDILGRGRLIVSFSPEDTLRLAADRLLGVGFEDRDDPLDATMRARGSEWRTRTFQIGSRGGVGRFLQSTVVEDTPLGLVPWFRPRLPSTLTVVCVRPLPIAATELVVMAHGAGNLSDTGSGAMPRVNDAIRAMADIAARAGALREFDRKYVTADATVPASRAAVREILGWM